MCFILFKVIASSQPFQINFAASNDTNVIDSIRVKNLTQNTTITLLGSDVLLLQKNNEIASVYNDAQLMIYPNPVKDKVNIIFNSIETCPALITLTSIQLKEVFNAKINANKGYNQVEIEGLGEGVFIIGIIMNNVTYNSKIISLSEGLFSPQLRASEIENVFNINKKNKVEMITMPYNVGERVLFTAFSKDYSTVSTMVPYQDETITFDFYPCIDRDMNSYSTVTIDAQVWMAENLKYLPAVSTHEDSSIIDPKYYVYDYSSINVPEAKQASSYNVYGVLYNWEASKNVCPMGWHLPTVEDWDQLAQYDPNGFGLKETGTEHWAWQMATNATGFTALPGGYYSPRFGFGYQRIFGIWWSNSVDTLGNPISFAIHTEYSALSKISDYSQGGYSVRCIKDFK